ncbi:hypothetical protein [Clostridium septicum]
MLKSGVDGEGSLILGYDDMDGVVIYSKISNSYLSSEIQGEEGSIVIDKINKFNNVKIVYRKGEIEEISNPQKVDDMCYEIEEFINLILNKKLESEVNSLENSRIVMKIMDEARKQIGLRYIAD